MIKIYNLIKKYHEKNFFLTLLVALITLPLFSEIKAQPLKQVLNYSTKTNKSFSTKISTDYLGSFTYSGVEYNLYGTYPDITSVTSSSGTVYAIAGECYLAQPFNLTSANVYINDSINGVFNYNGPVYF